MRVTPPPSSVTLPPPSITVLRSVGTLICEATGIVTGFGPQLNVTTARLPIAARRAAAVELRGVPSRTLGAVAGGSIAPAGGLQRPPAAGAGAAAAPATAWHS